MKQNKTWVCTVCSQTFTRNSSAKRHNINLHEGNGVYVRYTDYEIGRVQGKYFQNNPIFYKKKSAINYDISVVNSVIKAKDKKSQKTFYMIKLKR